MRHLAFLALTCSLFCGFAGPAKGVVWSDPSLQPPTQQTGVFKHTGRMLYTRFNVFGGTCIWIGGPWVLTAKHGVEKWSPSSLSVDFPAHGKQNYLIKAVHLPPEEKVDLAILELKKRPPFSQPPTLDTAKLSPGVKIRFGGYGNYGSSETIAGTNRFHWGTNTIDKTNSRIAWFSLGKPSQAEKHEATAAIFDSGSPVFRVENEQHYLTGIVILATNIASPKVGDRTGFVRLSEQSKWIKQITNRRE